MQTAPPNRETGSSAGNTEELLRAEIAELKRQLAHKANPHAAPPQGAPPPSHARLWALGLLIVVLTVVGFFTGYLPRHRRESVLVAEAKAVTQSLPTVNVATVERSNARTELVLPGSIQAVTEAPVLARASGYIIRRLVDIGDRVAAGQVLAEMEAPELDQQIKQTRAAVQQTQSSQEQALASLQQGRTNAELARVTAQRWNNLAAKGVVSRQENDTYQAQYESQAANVQSLEKAVAAARSNVAAAEANVARLMELKTYQTVRAPFAGVITLRNVDVGTLIGEGSTLLFRIAQTNRLRTYLNVPQNDAASVRVGQAAVLVFPEMGGRQFSGTVARMASALDPSTRTMLTEVQVANPDGALMPGMYAQVDLTMPRKEPPLLIPGDTLVIRGDGPQVALVAADQRVHYQHIQIGRDYGEKIEALTGLEAGQRVVVNPGDAVREGAKVNPVPVRQKPAPNAAPAGAPPQRPAGEQK